MKRHTTGGWRARIGVLALLGGGLFAAGLDGALHGPGTPAIALASVAISADATTSAGESAATETAVASEQNTALVDATATPDQENGTSDGAAPPEATSIPEPSVTTDAGPSSGDQNDTNGGAGDQADGSGDQGTSDEGAVHDGQFGQSIESNRQLQQEKTNQVNAGSNTFGSDTTGAQSAPQADQ